MFLREFCHLSNNVCKWPAKPLPFPEYQCNLRSNIQSPGVSRAHVSGNDSLAMWLLTELHCFKLRGGRGSLHLWIKRQQTPTELRRGNARISFVSDSYLGWRAVRKCTVISYNLQKSSMSRKQEETSLAPAIWRRKQYFLIPSLIKKDARWLFLRVLCVYYWQAGWKMKGLWSWRSAPEMPTEPARQCHTNQHMLYTYLGGMNLSQKFFSMAFHPPFVFFNWKLYEQWPEGSWWTFVSEQYFNLARGLAQHARDSSILTYGQSAAIKRGNKNQTICLHEQTVTGTFQE